MTLLGRGDGKRVTAGHFACQQTLFSLRQRALHRGPEVRPRPLRPPCPQVKLSEGGIENTVMVQGLQSRGFLNRGAPGVRPRDLRHDNGPVEFIDWRRLHPDEPIVEAKDGRPVGVSQAGSQRVMGGDTVSPAADAPR